MRKINKIKQDPKELQSMVEYYGQQYQEVYFVRDLLADCIIAVECAPANPSLATVERSTGLRNIFGYQELFYTTRLRMDTNSSGQRMVGYESKSGNDTRLSSYERGEVPQTSLEEVERGGVGAIRTLSPFEKAQLQATVAIKQAESNKEADYESYVNKKGHAVERFETFEIERMK